MKKNLIQFIIKNGFLHIFSASVINKIIQFCSSVILIRFFPKEQYGQYSYAGNILNFFLLVEGLGVCSGLLQYASENRSGEQKLGVVKLSLRYGLLFDAFLGFAIFIFSLIFILPIAGSVEILRWMFLIPLFTLFFNIVETYLRATLRNIQYSVLSVINTALFLVCAVIGVIWYGVWGVIIGRYVAYIISDIIAFLVIKKDFLALKYIELPEITFRREFLKYSIICMLSNSISGLLYLIDTFLVGFIIKESTVVAAYKTATVIPFALNFIPLSVMTYAYPHFAKINKDKVKFKKFFTMLLRYMAILNASISFGLFIFAPFIIQLVFGSAYSDSISPFRVLSIGYFFAGTFRIPAGNLLGAIKKVKVSLYESIICGALNIILDVLFITWWSSTGAAISTSSIYVVSGLIVNGYMIYYLNKKGQNTQNE